MPPRPQRQEPSRSLQRARLPYIGHAASEVRPAQAKSPHGLNATKATAPRAQLLILTSPPLHFKQTGSFLQFVLTSSPPNTDGRALTIYIDEPSTALQTDGLLPTILIDEPLLHFIQTGSSLQFLLTSPYCTSDRRAPPHNSY